MKKEQTNEFITIIASDLAGQVPEWVQALPFGSVKSTKGDFTVDEESMASIIKWFKARGNDLVIDYEHQTLTGDQAPAAGWIKEFAERGQDGLWAKVDWTKKAQEYLSNKEYRYFSPVVAVRVSDKKAVAIHSIGLTNTPAIAGMKPIANKDEFEEGKTMEFLQQLASALGLEATASEQQVMDAVKALKDAPAQVTANKEVLDLLDLKEDASLTEIKGRVIALKNPSGYVKAEEFQTLANKLAQRDRDDLVTMALTGGKITPAQKGWAEEYALKDPAGFKAFVEAAPQVVPLSKVSPSQAPNRGQVSDEVQLSINKMLGVDQEMFKKFGGDPSDGTN